MRERGLIVGVAVALAAVPGAAWAATTAQPLPAPRFAVPEAIAPAPPDAYLGAATDDRGNQLLAIDSQTTPARLLLSRAPSGSWAAEPAGSNESDPPLISAAGDGAAALTWESRLPDRTVRLHVLAREPRTTQFVEAGHVTLPGLRSFSTVVDEAGRVFALWRGGRDGALGLAIRPPGGAMGPARVLDTAVERYSMSVARSPGERVVMVWSARSAVRVLTAEHGRLGPIVDVAHVHGPVFSQVVAGPHGEALISWPDFRAGHVGTGFAVTRRARGGFGTPRRTRIPSDSLVIGGDARVVAARVRPLGRRSHGMKRRAIEVSSTSLDATSPRWVRLDTDVDATRSGPTAPVTLPVREGTLVAWTVTVGSDPHNRRIRAALVRHGHTSRVATVATYRGASSNPQILRRGAGATLVWQAGLGTHLQVYGADATDLGGQPLRRGPLCASHRCGPGN
jgi:hypothetical protein